MNNLNSQPAGDSSRASWNPSVRVVALLLLLLGPATGMAQDGRLSVDLAAASPRLRSNAPVQLMLDINWNDTTIIEGRFEMVYYSAGREIVCECESHDLVLSPGQQIVRLTMPTSGSNISFGQDEVALKFVAKDQTFDLKRYPLIVRSGARTMSICTVGSSSRAGRSEAEEEITSNLRVANLLRIGNQQGVVSTVTTHWAKEDVPETPLHFCTFDIVLLTPQGLSELRGKQLDAILSWVRAGGSICVFLDERLEANHVEFLNALVRQSCDLPFMLDTTGKFVSDQQHADAGVWQSHIELGRAAVIDLQSVSADPDELWQTSRSLASFLWKLRKDYQRSVLSVSRDAFESESEQASTQQTSRFNQVVWQPLQSTGQFINKLMPDEVEIVPMSLIGMVLLFYLLLIGPVDYFLLGYFKMRRFTWLMFPIITIAISFLCVKASEAYLSSTTTGSSLVVRDVGADGDVLRESRFKLIFLGSRTTITEEVNNELFTPLDQERLTLTASYALNYAYYGGGQNESTQAKYSGRLPSQYQVEQRIDQWRPQVNRRTSIQPEISIGDFDWNVGTQLTTDAGRRTVTKLIRSQWPEASVFVLRGNRKHQMSGSLVFMDPTFDPNDHRNYRYQQLNENHGPNAFLYGLCARGGDGIFQYFSQLSPNGGDNFEDLTLLDPTDTSQALLVIVVKEGSNTIVYRRLYTGLGQ